MSFYIQRQDKRYYGGTVDRQAVWVDDKMEAAPFRAREQAEVRLGGLPEDMTYEIVR